ncbi:esterase [Mycobacterium sp. NPDC003323]
MRVTPLAVTVLAAATTALSGLMGAPGASAAPPSCSDVDGVLGPDGNCTIVQNDPAYMLNISFPANYPDAKPVIDYVKQTRDGFLNVAKSPDFRGMPYELDSTATRYSSAVPPRGTESVVFTTYQNVGGAHPQTFYKSFSWDQAYRKPITFEKLFRAGVDPLPVIFPVVQADLAMQSGMPDPVLPEAGLDPANYQNFALTDDALIFFFSQGELLPESAGAVQVSVPRATVAPLLA